MSSEEMFRINDNIESDLVEAVTINKPRNSILLGQFNPSLNRLVHPLCISSFIYLNELNHITKSKKSIKLVVKLVGYCV